MSVRRAAGGMAYSPFVENVGHVVLIANRREIARPIYFFAVYDDEQLAVGRNGMRAE
jgi:hypothetical protein